MIIDTKKKKYTHFLNVLPYNALHMTTTYYFCVFVRKQADKADWDVAAIISLSREGFGPKGPLEVSSELLIQHASRGELQAVIQILQTGLVHPDVADSQGHTALIAATVTLFTITSFIKKFYF